MLYCSIFDILNDLISHHKSIVFLFSSFVSSRNLADISFDAKTYKIILEILKFRVDSFISVFLRFIHIVKLSQNNIKGFIKCVKEHDLLTIYPAALYSEIRVYQEKRLHRKILKLKIPCRMIAGYMSYHRHFFSLQQFISIIVMEIWYSSHFLLCTAVFTEIMTCCRS